jgi:uncharacterized protein DUF4349
MDRFDDDTLFAELRALRPKPRPEFTAELDERAAAGFPRRPAPSATAWPFVALADLWRGMSPRRRLMPALVVALAALVVATAVIAISQSGPKSNPADEAIVGMVPGPGESGAAAEESSGTFGAAEPSRHGGGGANGGAHHGSAAGGGAGHSASSGESVYEVEVPTVGSEAGTKANGTSAGTNAPIGGGGTGGEEEAAESGGSEEAYEAEPTFEAEESSGAVAGPANGVAGGGHRDIERSAYVILGTKPGEVSAAASKVYEAVHDAHGVVLHSKVDSGSAGATGAYFELLIPSGKVEDALSAFSQIAEVRERHDATNDITAPTVGAAEELRDSNATIESLLKDLGDAETEAEREAVEARLREERGHHAAIRARLDNLGKRASMSEVTVRIVTTHGAGASPAPPSNGNDRWGVGDALHDAGHILTIAAGVLLIALAVLAPIALILLALWLANRFRVRRLRERTLG